MTIKFTRQLLLSGYLMVASAIPVYAAETPASLSVLAQTLLEGHPAYLAAKAELDRASAQARASGQPLYNPEIEVEYEDATDITKTLGLSQTFDWSGKRRASRKVGDASIRVAQASLAQIRQQLLTELLTELSQLQTATASADLATRRISLLTEFLQLAKRRFAAGDIASSDVDLAQLALSEARMQAAVLNADVSTARAKVNALVAAPTAGWPALPDLPVAAAAGSLEQWLEQLPAMRQAAAESAAAKAGIQLAQKRRRADPTLALRGGKEEDNTLIGVTASIPLFVRNTFRSEVDAANAEAIRAEQRYYDLLRRARAEFQSAEQRYRLTRAALKDWQQSGQKSLHGRVRLLKQLWQTGEIDTTDYLVQLQQTLDTESASVDLLRTTWQAWVAWLAASGQTESWLGLVPASRSNEFK